MLEIILTIVFGIIGVASLIEAIRTIGSCRLQTISIGKG